MIKGGTVFRPTTKNVNLILALPYITRAPRFSRCQAFSGATHQYCGKYAEFKYKAGNTKRAHAPTGYWCWGHLFTHAIFSRVYDKERAERAFMKYEKERDANRTDSKDSGELPAAR